jgi:transmembrane 9 superfamily protein 2/4
VTILFAALGFMSPASHGMLLIGMVLLYFFLGIAAGYVAARMWRALKGTTAAGG